MGKTIPFPKEIADFIRANAPGTESHELTRMLNEKFGTNYEYKQIYTWKKNHKVRSGVITKFTTGHCPASKGRSERSMITNPEAYERWQNSWFKPGHSPHNRVPVGTEQNRLGYVWVKIAEPNVWKQKHLLIYEEQKGKIPKGMLVTFLDGNPKNMSLDNMFLISQGEHSTLNSNSRRNDNPEITKAEIGMIRLNNAIRGKYEKQAN